MNHIQINLFKVYLSPVSLVLGTIAIHNIIPSTLIQIYI